MKAGLYEFTLASMDALQNWFFWTWKVGFFGFVLVLRTLLIVMFAGWEFVYD
jgi:hypothetical protein